MNDREKSSGAAQHISAASEERFIATTEEFTRQSSRATIFWANVIQALLVACVVLWVLDVPRQVFRVSFYTEQLLAVTLGLTLALAFVTDTWRKAGSFDQGGLAASGVIFVYLVYHYVAKGGIAWPVVAAPLGLEFVDHFHLDQRGIHIEGDQAAVGADDRHLVRAIRAANRVEPDDDAGLALAGQFAGRALGFVHNGAAEVDFLFFFHVTFSGVGARMKRQSCGGLQGESMIGELMCSSRRDFRSKNSSVGRITSSCGCTVFGASA